MELEGIQRTFTRMIDGMDDLSYKERLNKLGLTTLLERRMRGDLIETYKILNGHNKYGTDFLLNFEEFKNFNDVLQIHSLASLQTVPLGQGIWFCLATLTFYTFKSSAYFRFLHGSWQKYIKETHERVLSFIQHAVCQSNQLNAIDKTS